MSSKWLERRKQLESALSACHPKNRRRQPATQKLLDAAEKRWLKFCGEVGTIAIKDATIVDFKLHLEWYLENSKVTHCSTLETSWKYLCTYYACETGHTMSKAISTEIWAFLGQLARQKKLHMDSKPKGVINHMDVMHLLEAHWDFGSFNRGDLQGRRKVQTALVLLLLSYTAGRPGAILETMCHPEEALKYKNIEIVAMRDNKGEIIMTMKVGYVLVKGNYGKGKNSTEFHCFEDKVSPLLCPLTLFFALALMDKAFEEIKSPSDIYAVCVPERRGDHGALRFRFRNDVLDKPVFVDGAGSPLNYDTFREDLKHLAKRAGFQVNVSPYLIRRGAGIALDSVSTNAQRMHAMNHQDVIVFRAYQPTSTLVDTQAAFLKQDPRLELKDRLLSAGLLRDPLAPIALTDKQKSTVKEEIQKQSDYISAMTSQMEQKRNLVAQYGKRNFLQKASKQEIKDYKKSGSCLVNIRRKAEKIKLDSIRKEWFDSACNMEIRKQLLGSEELLIDINGILEKGDNSTWDTNVLPARKLLIFSDPVPRSQMLDSLIQLIEGKLQLETEDTSILKCVYCEKHGFSDKYTLKRHLRSHLTKMKEPECRKCEKKFMSLEHLQAHLFDWHGIET